LLPFADRSFERALLQLVVHLVDRPHALGELARVLRPGGRLVICTIGPVRADGFWPARFFSSYANIDRARLPTPDALVDELRDAGSGQCAWSRSHSRCANSRDRALTLLRERFASTFALMHEDEYRAGLARAERELPASGVSCVHQLVIVSATVSLRQTTPATRP